MSTELTVWNYQNQEVRSVVIEGEHWWVARDVCNQLGLSDPAVALRKVDEEDRYILPILTNGGEQDTSVINESGLYTLIMRSHKPEAKVFRRWVTKTVLPTIRKTGKYESNPTPQPVNMEDALILVAQGYRELREEVDRLKEQVNKRATSPPVHSIHLALEDGNKLRHDIHRRICDCAIGGQWGSIPMIYRKIYDYVESVTGVILEQRSGHGKLKDAQARGFLHLVEDALTNIAPLYTH